MRFSQTNTQKQLVFAGGSIFKQLVRDVLTELSNKLQDPLRAVNAVVDLNLPTGKYEQLSKQNKWYANLSLLWDLSKKRV
jgi:hypothetical protein